jgi:hypothetical protein
MGELAARDLATVGGMGTDEGYRQRVIAANLPRYALIAGPDAEFLKAIDYAMDIINDVYAQPGGMDAYYAGQEVRAHIADVFAKRAVPYRYEDHEIVWAGDRHAYEIVIKPAVQALTDARLAGSRNEFEASLGHLRAGTQKELEDAIGRSREIGRKRNEGSYRRNRLDRFSDRYRPAALQHAARWRKAASLHRGIGTRRRSDPQ